MPNKTKLIVVLVFFTALIIGRFFFFSPKPALETFPKRTGLPPFAESIEISATFFPDKTCDIRNYGAIGNGQTMNTQAFRSAIEDCSKNGRGKVTVPAGQWLTGPINLKSNINLHLDKDAEILFSTNFSDYLPVVFSRYEGVEYYNYSPPIYTRDSQNVAITGEGRINGQAEKSWWNKDLFPVDKKNIKLYRMGQSEAPLSERVFGKPEDGFRPSLIEFINCDRVLLEGVTLINGPMWTIHPLYSQNITVKNVTVETVGGDSTDGVVIDSSKNVLIENSVFNSGDDAIAIKSGRDNDGLRVNRPSENILIKNCEAKKAHAAIAIGSEVSGGVRNVFVDNYSADDVEYGIRIKSGLERGGFVENIWIQNMNIQNAGVSAIELDQIYGDGISLSKNLEKKPTEFKDILISNLSCVKAQKSIVINGYSEKPINGVTLENLNIHSNKNILISNAENIKLSKFNLISKEGFQPAIKLKDSSSIQLEDLNIPKKQVLCENCQYDFR